MRILALVVGVFVAAGQARADRRDDLQARGEQLAKEKKYADAVAAFKEADKLQPRTIHACLIALAYTRAEQWPQAELFVARCRERASAGQPPPDWLPQLDQQLQDGQRKAGAAEVSIEVRPAEVHPLISISTFAADEMFEPRAIHLAPGSYSITVRATGYKDARQPLFISDQRPVRLIIDLTPDHKVVGGAATHDAAAGQTMLILGGVSVATAVATHIWMGYERSQLTKAGDTNDTQLYDAHSRRFDIARITTVGLYTIGAGCLVVGYLQKRSAKNEQPAVAAMPLAGGAFVSVEWQR